MKFTVENIIIKKGVTYYMNLLYIFGNQVEILA